MLKRCIYTPTEASSKKPVAGVPARGRRAVVRKPGRVDAGSERQLYLPLCGFEDDINGFIYLQPCAFSNLGFIFNNWGEAGFTQAFLDSFADWLDQPVAVVQVKLPQA